jgi:hypothetical protein
MREQPSKTSAFGLTGAKSHCALVSTLTNFLAVFVAAGAIIVIRIAVVILNTRS